MRSIQRWKLSNNQLKIISAKIVDCIDTFIEARVSKYDEMQIIDVKKHYNENIKNLAKVIGMILDDW